MKKQKLLLLLFAVCMAWNRTKAQSYSIESFEGAKVKIHLKETSSWYEAAVSCLTDTLFLEDYAGIKEVRVLNRNFLAIVYDTKGGSGSQFRNTMILSVFRNRIHVAMVVPSFGKSFGGDPDGSLYSVKFDINGNEKSNFKLIAHIYDRHKSNRHPQTNYLKNKQVILNFDPNQNIFYSNRKSIKHSFVIDGHDMPQPEKWEINETLPIIFLDDEARYYIKGKWYGLSGDSTLFEEYYRNHPVAHQLK